jgi:tetratricopeptide (TPR) repeat protein
MQLSRAEAENLARTGAAALQAGRPAEARQSFERLIAAGQVNAQIWLMQAYTCRAMGDLAEAGKAADEILRADGRNLRALLLKGDSLRAIADDRAASSFYGTAIKLAEQFGDLPPDLAAELEQARQISAQMAARYRQQLEGHLEAAGFGPGARSPRFQESIGILCEEKKVYFQQPSAYYFPGLPQKQYYEPEDFPWAGGVEAATGAMIDELTAALRDKAPFKPYLQAREDRPRYDFHGLLDNPAWSTLYLWENGGPVEGNVARFPRTFAALQDAPLTRITTRAPSILFSMLKAGARINAHNGMINTRLICHLPLVVPPNCGFRVGNEVREWEVGKLLIFDDTIEHEAWNDSDEDRIVLIFDVWRPELNLDERAAVTAIFEAIDGYDSPQPARN